MLEGSLTTSSSTPRASIARRVLARRAAYFSRVNLWLGSIFFGSSSFAPCGQMLTFENRSGVGRAGAVAGERGDCRVLDAGAGQVGDCEIRRRTPARPQPGNDLPKLRKFRICRHESG